MQITNLKALLAKAVLTAAAAAAFIAVPATSHAQAFVRFGYGRPVVVARPYGYAPYAYAPAPIVVGRPGFYRRPVVVARPGFYGRRFYR